MAVYSANVNVMIEAALKASRGLVRDFGELEHLQVSKKDAGGFVTNADLKAEKIIISELKKAKPDHGILSEEAGEIAGKNNYRWIIDPLDGTTNFMRGIPIFATTIALEEERKGEKKIIAGVTYLPIFNEIFWAEQNNGAWVERYYGVRNQRTRLQISNKSDMSNLVVAVGSMKNGGESQVKKIDKFTVIGASVRSIGSAAISLAYLAAGRFDYYFQAEESIWNVAAGIIMVREAKGKISNFEGSERIEDLQDIVACNKDLHGKFLKEIR